jgi:mRNA interferase MazF
VLAVTVTSNLDLADAPGNVPLLPRDSGLPRASVANVSQVLTLDRAQLESCVRSLPPAIMNAIDDGLRLSLEL